LLEKANEYNIQKGEAEAVALYWQENANHLATDDDNVRKKQTILNLTIIETPAIIMKLYKEQKITKEKYLNSTNELKKIGWFSNQVIDKMKMEAA
jgi:predicted nucleic acid-binding protein